MRQVVAVRRCATQPWYSNADPQGRSLYEADYLQDGVRYWMTLFARDELDAYRIVQRLEKEQTDGTT